MAGDVKKRMIEGTVNLLAHRGLAATSFSEVLELTGAPRGSLYHHFPDGKDQLVASAVGLAGDRAMGFLNALAGQSALEVTLRFLHLWREVLTRSQLKAGCAVLAVTVATDSPDLRQKTAEVFRGWRETLAELLEKGGLAPAKASGFAALMIASTEGAVVLSRAEQSLDSFELVAEQLLDRLRQLGATAG